MSMYITELGKRKFACGLFWQSLSRPRELAREARELARKIDCDLVVLRKEYATAQAGYAKGGGGLRGSVYSLAAAVSKTLAKAGATYDGENQPVHNWLGAFRLPDGKWAYLAMRDANFLPDGDFAGSKEEVFERLRSDYAMGGWNMVLGDAELEDYGFHNFTARRIEELLAHTGDGQVRVHASWLLLPLKGDMPLRQVAFIGLLVLLGCGAAMVGWRQHRDREEQAARAEAMAQAQARLLRESGVANVHPWRSQPLPLVLTQACVARLAHLNPGGWALSEYACSADAVSYTWVRQESSVALLLAQVPEAQIELDGETASLRLPLQLTTGSDEPLLTHQAVLLPLLSSLQFMRVPGKFSEPAPAPLPPSEDGLPAPALGWRAYRYQLGPITSSPLELATVLSQPGIRLEKLAYRGGVWSIEGVIYEK